MTVENRTRYLAAMFMAGDIQESKDDIRWKILKYAPEDRQQYIDRLIEEIHNWDYQNEEFEDFEP